jgi:UDP-3-O-[3-hydroxymyristoyl] N-acetylglucosamine deacetylase
MQHTIRKAVRISGVGLHTGCQVTLELKPAPVDTGLVFRRVDLQNFRIEALRKHVSRVILATTLLKRGVRLSTVEHVLSALYGLGIDNVFIDIDSLEVPIVDGSALPFVEMIKKAGTKRQEKERSYLVVDKPFRFEDGEKYIEVQPSHCFGVAYEIEFSHPVIGRQTIDLEVTAESYERELSFARTFGFRADVEQLLNKGLVRGGSFDNAVVLDHERVMNGTLRSPDEFVRHKALDLIGDVALCGSPLIGHIRAHKAGHALHTTLATHLARHNSTCRRVPESQLRAYSRAVGL